jgi:hypothetical protein
MIATQSFAPVLSALAEEYAREADTVLDLRAAALQEPHPGRCVQCYFKLLGATRTAEKLARLSPLRQWIEEHITIAAKAPSAEPFEFLRVDLDEVDDLESYCRRVSSTLFFDRADLPTAVELEFAFRDAVVA